MREIKFKCWDLTTKKWLCVDDMPTVSFDTESLVMELGEDWVEFVQYTGLRDRNGVEIYESDFVEFTLVDTGKKSRGFVEWDDEDAGFYFDNVNNSFPCVKFYYATEFEVIGNKFENPELLE